MKAELAKLLAAWPKLTKSQIKDRLKKLAKVVVPLLLLGCWVGCATSEPQPLSAWGYDGWDTNAPPMTPITNHIYRP